MKPSQRKSLAGMVLGVGILVGVNKVNSPVRLIYNPSESAPRGWYWQHSTSGHAVGDFVLVHLPESVAALADQRRYLPRGVPLLKRIGTTAGEWVCYRDGSIWIGSKVAAPVRFVDGAGRVLPVWRGCQKLRGDQYFLLSNTIASSFDSRYFGPISSEQILGAAVPIWTW